MKPDWKDAPEWANYLARDGDGTWCWYEKRPTLDFIHNMWQPHWEEVFHEINPWEDSLEQRPAEVTDYNLYTSPLE